MIRRGMYYLRRMFIAQVSILQMILIMLQQTYLVIILTLLDYNGGVIVVHLIISKVLEVTNG